MYILRKLALLVFYVIREASKSHNRNTYFHCKYIFLQEQKSLSMLCDSNSKTFLFTSINHGDFININIYLKYNFKNIQHL